MTENMCQSQVETSSQKSRPQQQAQPPVHSALPLLPQHANPSEQSDGAGSIESIARNARGELVVRVKGLAEPVIDARVARCFPWTCPDGYVSIRDKDGKELALFATLASLDEPNRRVVEQELRDKVFNPRIRRILDYKSEFGVVNMTAQTDRGDVTFQIRSRDDIRILSGTRALFRDADGNVYELPDLAEMDAASQKWLYEYF